ncbi:hypothetical protein A225_3978 [Klebsiella michiganensis E718]|nr:hypothetical protein A225_3978 [Klebsiella michiganensis E718]
MPGAVGNPTRGILENGDIYRFNFHARSLSRPNPIDRSKSVKWFHIIENTFQYLI